MERNQENPRSRSIDDRDGPGVYSNLAMIAHSENEFILDFIFIQPQAPRAKSGQGCLPLPPT